MDVKLTRRSTYPTDPVCDAMQEVHLTDWSVDPNDHSRPKHVRECSASDLWAAGHDAAPEKATRALAQHLHTVRKVLNGKASLNDLGGSYDALQAAPETAALIRQAEERSGST